MYWIDGSIYKGDWDLGMQHGFGEITLPNKQSIKGEFK
jgi:hypothetical protein